MGALSYNAMYYMAAVEWSMPQHISKYLYEFASIYDKTFEAGVTSICWLKNLINMCVRIQALLSPDQADQERTSRSEVPQAKLLNLPSFPLREAK